MEKYTAKKMRKMFLDFFSSKEHVVIKSSSLIPENDPTVLFTTAGMHPLTTYLLGQKHPAGCRLTNVQKCVRTGDIDEVGDNSHCTFFEMLGNWSLGDYFKKEAIEWSFEFLTSPKWMGLPIEKLAVSVFAGDTDCPMDVESAQIWEKCGIPKEKIFFLPKKNNWWGPAGTTGPCGPDTEMFFNTGKPKCGEDCGPQCDCGKYLEIWNDVFMQYNKNAEGKFEPLGQKNVDTGMGLERTVCVLNGFSSVYETDVFSDAIKLIENSCGKKADENMQNTKAIRIIADHIRTATFMLGDEVGIVPSNVDQGYVLRRLIRRAVRYMRQLDVKSSLAVELAKHFVAVYGEVYPELVQNQAKIVNELSKEEDKFGKTLEQGLKEFEKLVQKVESDKIDGVSAFRLYDTFGFPIEMTVEFALEKGMAVDTKGFEDCFAEHQKKSQAGSEQRFKGGLADNSEKTTNLHTATHLLQAALRQVLGDEVAQKGSNITEERLRFDFTFHRPMTAEEIAQTQLLVNEVIASDQLINCCEMTVEEAKKCGAIGLFGDKYGEVVKVYSAGSFSKEICGGPHALRTGQLGKFVISKEQSSSSGVRRIKAELV